MNAHQLFVQAWEKTLKIDFDPTWKNGTGYLDYITDDINLKLEKDVIVGTTDDLGRKVLIKGLGSDLYLVVFERGRNEVLVCNTPSMRSLKKANIERDFNGFQSSLSKGTVEVFLGLKESNVLFYKEFAAKVLKEIKLTTSVAIGTKLVNDIENEVPILSSVLKDVGIDLNSITVHFNAKDYNV